MKELQFVDLYSQYISIKEEIDSAIHDVIKGSHFVRGPFVEKFEKKFKEIFNVPYCISCANGTDALYIAMHALGVKSGDEVICPAHSWISTSETISQSGAKVVFCDTTADTFTIDAEKIRNLITDKTVGIIPVHLFGQSADMDPIMDIAKERKLWVLEDCAQAHLAEYKGRMVGTIGDIGSFSFYPGKNLGAMGDAGGLITSNGDLSQDMAMFARHGGVNKGEHFIEGINSRMDGLQAAILDVKANYIHAWTQKRQEIAEKYLLNIKNDKIKLPQVSKFSTHVWHLFVVKTENRDELRKYLASHNIPSVINYPVALPFLPAYEYLKATHEQFPNAYHNQSRILSIPLHPDLNCEQQDYIISILNKF